MRKELKILSVLALLLTGQLVFAQIKGKVQEADGQPAMGAKVKIKGTDVSTRTNDDGEFELSSGKVGDVLVITNLDDVSKEVTATSDNITFTYPKPDEKVKDLEGVVVLGFGRVRDAKEVVGTATVVKGADIAASPSASFDKALAGRVSGMNVTSANGQPGGLAQVRLRGVTSVTGNNNPIYIIDGVRVSSGSLTSDRNRSTTDPSTNVLSTINPNDIESYTVLKDAAATALYGADAGAGVIVITTKRGREGKAKFTLDFETGANQKAVKGAKPITGENWNKLYTESVKNAGGFSTDQQAINYINNSLVPIGYGALWDPTNPLTPTPTNWGDLVERSAAPQNSVNLGVSGGSDRMTYVSSLNYFSQDGVVKNTDFDRIAGRLGMEYKATDRLTLRYDINAAYTKQNSVLAGGYFSNPLLSKYFNLPSDPAYLDPQKTIINIGEDGRLSNGQFNPLYVLENDYTQTKTARFFGNLQGEYKILDNLKYILNFAPEYINLEREQYNNPISGDGMGEVGGRLQEARTRLFNWNLQNILNYTFNLGEDHHFDARLIQEAYKSEYRYLYTSNTSQGEFSLYQPDVFVKMESIGGNGYNSTRVAYAANVNYDYAKRYYLDATVREEALNNFYSGNKWGTFWSVGGSWVVSNESFMKNATSVNLLKLKASYGELGNKLNYDDINSFPLYGYDLNYNDYAGAYIYQYGDRNFTWERVKQWDLGFESGFFNNRFTFSASFFNKKTSDLIMRRFVSLATGSTDRSGLSTVLTNIGNMVNKGVEVDLGFTPVKTQSGFTWNISGNFSYIKNEVTSLPLGDNVTGINIVREGEAVNSWYLRTWAGVNPNTGVGQWEVNNSVLEQQYNTCIQSGGCGTSPDPALQAVQVLIDKGIIYYDQNGKFLTNNYDTAQRVIHGNPVPKYNAGLSMDFAYKGFSLSFTLSGAFDFKVYDAWRNYTTSDGQFMGQYAGYDAAAHDYWTPDNPNAKNPQPVFGNSTKSNSNSTRFLYDGDFVRLRDLTVGYSFPKDMINAIGLTNLRVYLKGSNIWTYCFDKDMRNLHLEPEQNLNGGGTNFEQPVLKTYTLGVNLGF